MTKNELTTDNVTQQAEGRPTLIAAAKMAQEAADAILNRSEPTTGEIVRSLKNCADTDARKRPCTTDCYYFDKSVDCQVDLYNAAIDCLESDVRTIADKDAKIAELTARAEKAEKLVKRYEDNIDRQNADYRTW